MSRGEEQDACAYCARVLCSEEFLIMPIILSLPSPRQLDPLAPLVTTHEDEVEAQLSLKLPLRCYSRLAACRCSYHAAIAIDFEGTVSKFPPRFSEASIWGIGAKEKDVIRAELGRVKIK